MPAPPREGCDAVVAELAALAPTTLTVTQPTGELVLPPPEPRPAPQPAKAPVHVFHEGSHDDVH